MNKGCGGHGQYNIGGITSGNKKIYVDDEYIKSVKEFNEKYKDINCRNCKRINRCIMGDEIIYPDCGELRKERLDKDTKERIIAIIDFLLVVIVLAIICLLLSSCDVLDNKDNNLIEIKVTSGKYSYVTMINKREYRDRKSKLPERHIDGNTITFTKCTIVIERMNKDSINVIIRGALDNSVYRMDNIFNCSQRNWFKYMQEYGVIELTGIDLVITIEGDKDNE